ncbi:MAG: NHL repeat-containing protein [Planctomycetota bacterium]|jgi:sugar lactone lactonase YvrE
MKRIHLLIILLAVLICYASFAGAADNTEPDRDFRRATIKPSMVRLEPGRQQKFKIIMSPRYLQPAYLAENVKWAVNGIPGGNKKVGIIDAAGLYTAPARTPKPHEIHICAEVEGAGNRQLFATVLMANPDPPYRLIRTWPEPADSPTYFEKPHGIGFDKDGNILIADQDNSRVMRFTPEGKYLGDIGPGSGSKPGTFTEPRVVLTDTEGRIWVSDSKADEPRIQVFTPDGTFIRWFAHKGILPGQLLRAHGMDFDSQQRLFVVDVDNFCVNVYSHSGEFLYSWGQPGLKIGTFNAPHGLVVDPSDDVFVSSFYGPTQKFDPNGNLLFAFAYADPPDGPVGCHSIAGDRWGNVYMTAQATRQGKKVHIAKYNNNGDYITAWSLAEPDQQAIWFAVDDVGTVYVLFSGGDKMGVQVFEPQ